MASSEFRVLLYVYIYFLYIPVVVAVVVVVVVIVFFFFFFDEVSNFRNIILSYQKPRFVIRNCQWNCVATLVDFGSMGRVIIQIRDRAFKTHTQAFGILLSLQKLG